jgi:hypothetical protein
MVGGLCVPLYRVGSAGFLGHGERIGPGRWHGRNRSRPYLPDRFRTLPDRARFVEYCEGCEH